MKKNLHFIYQRTLSKYHKFKSRYNKGLSSGRFFELSEKKQHQIISRLAKLQQRLQQLRLQLKLAIAGGSLAFILGATQVHGQQVGPFKENIAKNPFPPTLPEYNRTNPALVDIDNDGDLDVFIGEKFGSIDFFRNDGTPERPVFTYQNGSNNPVSGIDIGNNAAPAFADMDGDGDFDLIVGEQSQFIYSPGPNVNYFENTGTKEAPIFATTPVTGPNPVSNLQSDDNYSHPSFVDIDNDGDLDAFVGGGYGGYYGFPMYEYRETITFWRNNGTNPSTFTRESGSSNLLAVVNAEFGGTLDVAAPAFVDIDGDGDFDAFIGDHDGTIRFFRNEGTASSPSFPSETTGSANPFNGVDLGNYASPEFGDFDNDGDFDMVVGSDLGNDAFGNPYYGPIQYFENTGDANNPSFTELTGTDSPFIGVSVGYYDTSPSVFDIDNDGDLDLVIGAKYSNPDKIYLFRNNGDATFTELTGASNPFAGILNSSFERPIPEFADIDNDGDMDLFVGAVYYSGPSNAQIRFFRNDGNNNFTSDTSPITKNQNYTNFAQTLGDFDGDGDFDAVIGTYNANYTSANFIYLENQGSATSPNFVEQNVASAPFNGFQISTGYQAYAKPLFVDIDHDGDMDVVSGVEGYNALSRGGEFIYFENDGSGSLTEITGASNPFTGIDIGNVSDPTMLDVDNDGDLDIISGNSSGGLNFIENVNLAPALSSNGTGGVTYTEGDPPVKIAPILAIADDGNDDIIGAQVAITNYVAGEDELIFTNQASITGNFDATTGVLTLTGYATLAQYESALQSVAYQNTSVSPDETTRVIQFSATDFDATDPLLDGINDFTTTIEVIAVNEPPSIASATETTQFGSQITIDLCSISSDPDNDALTFSILNVLSGATTSINGCNLVVDYSAVNFTGSDEITVQTCDPSGACAQNVLSINVIEPTSSDIEVYNAVSPNGDGENDWWIITGLTAPNRIEIYNRWGDRVKTLIDFESSVSTPNNALDDLPAGTYFYKIESDTQGSLNGYLVIKK